jgi:diacylglycerol O-acyltransferase
MQRLSFVDHALHKVSATGLPHMYMQGAMILGPSRAGRTQDPHGLAEHLASRLSVIPALRQKLVQDALHVGDLRLVDDPEFDVWNHIGFRRLRRPSGERALFRYLGRFAAEPLAVDRPPWRFEIIDGLPQGRLAVATKLSHATMDGATSVKVFGAMYDERPVRPSRYTPPVWSPHRTPSQPALLAGAVRDSLERVAARAPRFALRLAADSARAAARRVRGRRSEARAVADAKRTSLNAVVSGGRRNIAVVNFPIDRLKELCGRLGCRVNDLCLLLASEALLAYFEGIGEKVDFDLVLGMPINVRRPGDRTVGNEVSLGRVSAHNTAGSITERLRAIQADARAAKDEAARNALDAPTLMTDLGELVPPLLIDVAGWLLATTQPWDRLPVAMNAVVTNVAGPRDALYVADRRVEGNVPIVPVFHMGALGIAVSSLGERLTIGFTACADVVREKNMHLLVDGAKRGLRRVESALRER